MMRDSPLPWAISVLGGSVADTQLVRVAVQRGGHVRVGLEDYGGEACPSNADLVREIAAIASAAGRPVATPEQASNILRLVR
jgi:uncharacterized protein (DUF849 family)